MTEIKIKKIYNTAEELNNSEEYNELWKGFQKRNIQKDYFKKGFLTEDGKIYTVSEMKEKSEKGLCILMERTICGVLDNRAFAIGFYSSLRNTLVIEETKGYARDFETRSKLADHCRQFNHHPNEHLVFVTTSF